MTLEIIDFDLLLTNLAYFYQIINVYFILSKLGIYFTLNNLRVIDLMIFLITIFESFITIISMICSI